MPEDEYIWIGFSKIFQIFGTFGLKCMVLPLNLNICKKVVRPSIMLQYPNYKDAENLVFEFRFRFKSTLETCDIRNPQPHPQSKKDFLNSKQV